MRGSRSRSLIAGITCALAVAMLIAPGSPDEAAAQGVTCTTEVEPNDLPETSQVLTGDVCIEGDLAQLNDQDLFVWDVPALGALHAWTLAIEGVPETITSVRLYRVTTGPGAVPAVDNRELMRVDSSATDRTPGIMTDVTFAPGRYLLGISRGAPVGGGDLPAGPYTARLEVTGVVPPSGDIEPNDDTASAAPLGASFELAGDAAGTQDVFAWTLTDEEAGTSWDISMRMPFAAVGSSNVILSSMTGSMLAQAPVGPEGLARIYDLRLPPATYLVTVPAAAGPQPYVLGSAVSVVASSDAEPNDTPATAVFLDPAAGPVRGRLARDQDTDFYVLPVDARLAETQFDVALTWTTGPPRQVCLFRDTNTVMQCRQGAQGASVLSNLRLDVGDYTLQVVGDESPEDGYEISIQDVGPARADREIEPNDDGLTAATFDPSVVMTGRADAGDDDYYRVVVTGEPGLWRLEAAGTDLELLEWTGRDKSVMASGQVSADRTAASLWDLYLVPGSHWVHVRASGGDYRLTMTALGPIDATSEREPNNDALTAQTIVVDTARVGRLPDAADVDTFRFSLRATDHVVIRLDPPDDGAIELDVVSAGTTLTSLRHPVAGTSLAYDALLWPGDYEVRVRSDSGSVSPYTLRLERLDPFALPADLEPNDTAGLARPLPSTLEAVGSGWGTAGEDDWYQLPPLTSDAAVQLEVTGEATLVGLEDASSSLSWTPGPASGQYLSAPIPAGAQVLLRVTATGPYRVRVTSAGLSDPPADVMAVDPPPTLEVVTDIAEVAAWSTFGQRPTVSVVMTSQGTTDATVTLETTVSDLGWSVEAAASSVEVPAGGSVTVPLLVAIPADARAGVPVRISVRATTPNGASSTDFVDILPRSAAPAVGAVQDWPLPAALLGGLDVASLAVGGAIHGSADPGRESLLHDGLAVTGSGYSPQARDDALTMSVDLAGDDPVLVAGTIVNALAFDGQLAYRPRDFELLLSDDAVTWQTVLTGELTPVSTDQSFVLDRPVAARFARLRITSAYGMLISGGPITYAPLGEWKVIAVPGSVVSTAPWNIADPTRGGHVVWMDPQPNTEALVTGILSADPTPWLPYIARNRPPSWVVGFQSDRTAQLAEFQWVDPPGSTPETRPNQVQLEVSVEGPVGPWRSVGSWSLVRGADGLVAPIVFPEPVWARFVRFSPNAPVDTDSAWEMPSTLRVLERAEDATYRSILGEWGMGSPLGIHELLVPPLSAIGDAGDADDDTSATASPLAVGEVASGTVQRQQDEDWFVLATPAGQDQLILELQGRRYVDATVELYDDAGVGVPVKESEGRSAGFARITAVVVPGATYRLRVQQPPFSLVVTYDTSGSLGPYLSYVGQAIRVFAAGVRRNEEAVLIVPFEELALLDDWSDDPNALQSAVEGQVLGAFSSGVEASVLEAAKRVEQRPGTRAILVMSDGETLSYDMRTAMYESVGTARPLIFSVHVAGSGASVDSSNLMRDLSSNGGHYQYAASHGDIDGAFDRVATWLRGPAPYSVSYTTAEIPRLPGSISVRSESGPVVIGGDVAIELVLDTSGSMLRKIGKQQRIQIAKIVLRSLVTDTLPAGIPVALRTFKSGKGSCGTVMAVPLGPLDRATMAARIKGLKINKGTKTPIGATLRQVAGDLAGVEGPKVVVLVTDGEETCKGDPAAEVAALVARGLDVQVNIVAFAIDDEQLQADIASWAAIGNGTSFQADDATELGAAIAKALAAPFRVYDETGTLIASGIVGGPSVAVPVGSYRVDVLTDPMATFEAVVVTSGAGIDLVLGDPAP